MIYKYEEPKIHTRINGKVTKVVDGDTMEITTQENKTFIVRLWGIDSPEKKQSFGIQAKEFIEVKILNQQAEFDLISVGKYDRNIGKLFLRNKENQRVDVAVVLLFNGFAHCSTQNIEDPYFTHEYSAKYSKIGLWSEKDAISPRDFRDKDTVKMKEKTRDTSLQEYKDPIAEKSLHKNKDNTLEKSNKEENTPAGKKTIVPYPDSFPNNKYRKKKNSFKRT